MNVRDLLYPPPPVRVLLLHDRLGRPVEVVRDEGYLLVQRPEGVADHPPTPLSSTRYSWAHLGHTAGTAALPVRLISL